MKVGDITQYGKEKAIIIKIRGNEYEVRTQSTYTGYWNDQKEYMIHRYYDCKFTYYYKYINSNKLLYYKYKILGSIFGFYDGILSLYEDEDYSHKIIITIFLLMLSIGILLLIYMVYMIATGHT